MTEKPFDKYKKNIFSQNGEDGIIEEILNRLSLKTINNLWCCEFGAWDGKKFSNTFSLVQKGWNAVYIEGDTQRFDELKSTCSEYPKIIPIQAFVGNSVGTTNSLDNILSPTSIPSEFEILSIDIDSYDLDVWESLLKYRPKIVLIEINSSIAPGIYLRNSNKRSGNSFSSTLQIGKDKGYTLLSHVGNLIFLRNDLIEFMRIPDRFIKYPELLFSYDWLSDKNI